MLPNAKPSTTLDDFGDAVDLNYSLFEFGTTILIVAAPT